MLLAGAVALVAALVLLVALDLICDFAGQECNDFEFDEEQGK